MTPEQERILWMWMQRREEVLRDAEKRELSNFHDTQLERAVDALKSVMIYAEKTSPGKKPSLN